MAPATKATVRKFEVVRTINLGTKGGKTPIRETGDEVLGTEVSEQDLKILLATGYLRDADAPIPPSQAEGVAAFDRLVNIATKIGVVKRDGAKYRIGETEAKGLGEFRNAVSIDQLEAAIVKAFDR